MLSVRVFEKLKAAGFIVDGREATREWSKEVDVAFYGKHTEVYKVTALALSPDCVTVFFLVNGRVKKQKSYTSSVGRVVNAIKETVQCAGYKF